MLVKVLREDNVLKFIDVDGYVYKYTDNTRELERLPDGSEVSISPEYLKKETVSVEVTEVVIPEDTTEKETPDDEIEEEDIQTDEAEEGE